MIATSESFFENLNLYFGADSEKIIDSDMTVHIMNQGLCISFSIDEEHNVLITEINKCGFTGTELLERIELLAQNEGAPKIMLEDQSSVTYGAYRLDLASLSILTKGRSWYNSMGYYSENHGFESQEWEVIRRSRIADILVHLSTITYDEYISKNKGWFDDGLDLFAYLNETEVTEENFEDMLNEFVYYLSATFDVNDTAESFGIILSILSKNNVSEDYECMNYLMMLGAISYSIRYTRHPLVKNI